MVPMGGMTILFLSLREPILMGVSRLGILLTEKEWWDVKKRVWGMGDSSEVPFYL